MEGGYHSYGRWLHLGRRVCECSRLVSTHPVTDSLRLVDQVDELEEAKRISLLEYRTSASGQPVAGSSHIVNGSSRGFETELQNELSRVETEIYNTRAKLDSLLTEKNEILKDLQEHRKSVAAAEEDARDREPAVNYMDDFDWTSALKTTMKRVFNINDFRLCQKG